MAIDYGLLDRSTLSAPLFYPSPDPTVAPHGARDHRIEVAPGITVAARHHAHPGPPSDRRGAVLYFHGNGEVVGDHDHLARSFHDIGLDLFVVTYRGYGASDGTPTFAALVADVHPIAERFHQILDAEGGPGLRLVMGRSLGGHAALEVAAHCPERFDALVLSSPAGEGSRLADRIVDVPEPTVRALLAAHEAKLAKITLPTLLVHGSRDELIPLSSVERLAKLLTAAAERTMVIIDGASHNDLLWLAHDAYFGAIGELVERCLIQDPGRAGAAARG